MARDEGGRVEGKVALVTGGGSGLGRATALLLAREGAAVAASDINEAAAQETAGMIAEAGGTAQVYRHDVTAEADWERIMADITARFGGLDILFNNAGVSGGATALDAMSLEEWRSITTVNLDGVFLGVKHGIRAMKARGGGSIVNTSSVAGIVGLPGAGAYCASKGGVRLLTKAAALECARRRTGIRVNSVHPGFIRTPMLQAGLDGPHGEGVARLIERLQPGGEAGEPQDIAEGVLYLASDAARFVNGSELVIDGGILAA